MRKVIICAISVLLLSAIVVGDEQKGMRPVIGTDGVLSEEPYHAKWALLIGINKYPNLPVQYQLHYAENDVKELKKVLTEQYKFPESNIITLINEQATYQGIREKFAQLSDSNKVDPNDCMLVYFSGHGQTVQKPRGGDMGFLIPYDAKVDMNNVSSPSTYYANCLGMDELKRLAGMIPAKHVMFLVDSCYSGLAVTNRGGLNISLPSYLKKVASVPVQQLITAGGKDDMSSESPEWGHGAFTYKLLEALRTGVADENDDGVTTGLELAAHLRNVVPNISPKQNPQYGYFEGEGEFLFLNVNQPMLPTNLNITKPIINLPPSESTQTTIDNQSSNNNLPKEIIGKDGAPMVLIPAGEFKMGGYDNKNTTLHKVELDAFYIDKYEVTNILYKQFLIATNRKIPKDCNNSKLSVPNQPVINVTWEDARAYAEWAGKRLPTDAEWEKAARGGLIEKKYPWGDEIRLNDANFLEHGAKHPIDIGQFKPNGYGLYDMMGNVWEWCNDWYDDRYYSISPNQNPKGPISGNKKVIRGGSWAETIDKNRVVRGIINIGVGDIILFPMISDRQSKKPDITSDRIGFRCVQDVPK